jgi:tRNA(Ile)-lysidine synthase
LLQNITTFIHEHNLLPMGSRIIVGLSGGPDSVFLLHVLKHLQEDRALTIIAAHLDHEWRSNSHEDALFCEQLARSLDIELVTKKYSDFDAPKYNGSREAQARTVRNAFFEQLAAEKNCSHIALGHHADDQQETFFIRLIRGSSLSGLAGMRAQQGKYVRPLLETKKEDILAYLSAHNIPYRIDETNTSNTFLRNRIRNNCLPTLLATDDRTYDNFSKTIKQLQQADAALEHIAQSILQSITVTQNDDAWICIPTLLEQPIHLGNRIIVQWLIENRVPFTISESLLHEIRRFLAHGSGKHQLGEQWAVVKKNNKARILLLL